VNKSHHRLYRLFADAEMPKVAPKPVPDANTRSQPKNSIETIVAVTERTTATTQQQCNAEGQEHPQY
jgi:hypothetical protein